MAYQILVLTSEYLSRYMDDILKTHSQVLLYRIVEYRCFSEVGALYRANEQWADGVLTTGIVVETVIRREVKGIRKPILSLDTDNESFYKVPLTLLIENRQIDPERIIFDVFVCISPNASVLDLIQNKSVDDMFPYFDTWLDQASAEELYQVEERCVAKIRKLWQEDMIDVVICRYSSIVKRLKELEIPCVFAAATDEYAHQKVEHLLAKIKLEKIAAHLPAAVFTSPRKAGESWSEYQELNVQKSLMDFAKEYDLKFLIQKKREGLLIITQKNVISYLTGGNQESILSEYLENSLNLELTISYGIGNTIEDALENAKAAYQAAGVSGDTFLVDEEKRLIGPLDKKRRVLASEMINPQIQAAAKKASLSTMVIHRLNRLLCLLGKREITSRELADNFHITVREASRILKKLETAGLASVMLQKSEHMRGRPTKIYHINWEL
ncbi:MAG: hypothetical protein HFG81_12180 [Dorea sp.]|nr:hypothetical protein [Dorea sp.]